MKKNFHEVNASRVHETADAETMSRRVGESYGNRQSSIIKYDHTCANSADIRDVHCGVSSTPVCLHASQQLLEHRRNIFLAIVAAAHCQEYFRQPEKIVSENRNVGDNLGHYSFTYETEGGIVQSETGSRKYAGTPSETQLIQGSVQYNAPDGTPIAISWTADEFGTQVAGSHVPTPPPIPPAIQKALDWIAKQPSTPEPELAAKDSPSQQNAVPASTNRQYKSLRSNQRN